MKRGPIQRKCEVHLGGDCVLAVRMKLVVRGSHEG